MAEIVLKDSSGQPRSYPGVQSVGLYDSGGNLREFSLSSGGGDEPEHAICFYDHTGKRIHSYTRAEAQVLTAWPEFPAVQGTTLVARNFTPQGQLSLSSVKSCKTWMDLYPFYQHDILHIRLFKETAVTLTLTLGFSNVGDGSAEIDWNDGSSMETATGSGSAVSISHTYAAGEYDLLIKNASTVPSGYSWDYRAFAQYGSGSFTPVISPASCLLSASVSTCGLSESAFYGCSFLRYLSLRSLGGAGGTSTNAFTGCDSLRCLHIPGNSRVLYKNLSNQRLKRCAVMPAAASAEAERISLINVPGVVSSFLNLAEASKYPQEIVTELSEVTMASNLQPGTDWANTKIYVPDNDLAAYQAKTGFSQISDNIFPLSSYPDF